MYLVAVLNAMATAVSIFFKLIFAYHDQYHKTNIKHCININLLVCFFAARKKATGQE
jgi:hypothetical protein